MIYIQGLQNQKFCELLTLSVFNHVKSNEGHEEGQEGDSASTSNQGHEGHEVKCLTQEMIKASLWRPMKAVEAALDLFIFSGHVFLWTSVKKCSLLITYNFAFF